MSAAGARSVAGMLAGFAAGTLSPVETLESCLASIDDRIGAFTVVCADRARDEARAAEAAWRRGEPAGPLCGVPFAVKDVFDTAGIETACGSPMLAGRIPARDAEAVRRMRAAGAIMIGKTTTQEFAWGLAMTGRDGEPITRNPRDPQRMPGGSSGGSAAAVAMGAAPLALGTDTGGSIRLPAAWCGVVGHKPTHGLVPLDGVWPLAPSLDHAGPIARCPEDVALALQALGGPAPTPAPPGLRIGGPELLPDPALVHAAYDAVRLPETLAAHRAAGLWPGRAADYPPLLRELLRRAERMAPDPAAREPFAAHMAAVFDEVDLIVSPVAAIGPPRFDERLELRPLVTPHVALQNLLGLPACALPDGLQVTGPSGADQLVLAHARSRAAR